MALHRSLVVALFTVLACVYGQEPPRHLILTYRAFPNQRIAFHDTMERGIGSRLTRLRDSGKLNSFRMVFSTFIDGDSWDGLAIVQLAGNEGLDAWRRLERTAPAALSPAELANTTYATVVPADLIEQSSADDDAQTPGVYLVIPYEYRVSASVFRNYARGFIVPEMAGWMKQGGLLGYQLFMARFPVGRPWNAILVLHYQDWNGLGQRDAVLAQIGAQLAADPTWKSWSDRSQDICVEKTAMIAEPVGIP